MPNIIIDVNDKNVDLVLSIINNLKAGLINKVDVLNNQKELKAVSSSLNKEENKTRYMSKKNYKEKLLAKDEKKTSTNRYLTPAEYRKNLK